jgi:hypothetical protein
MPIMLEKLYDALRAADVPDDKARAAAVEVAEFKDAFAAMRTDLAVLKGMVGINLALSLAIVVKLFTT